MLKVPLYCKYIDLHSMRMVAMVEVVSSEQVVKPHSRQAVVKPEVLHLLECLYTGYRGLPVAIKMGVVFIKWAWLEIFQAH